MKAAEWGRGGLWLIVINWLNGTQKDVSTAIGGGCVQYVALANPGSRWVKKYCWDSGFFVGEAKWWRKRRDERNFQNSSPLTVNQRILSKDLIRSAAGAHPDLLLPVLHRHNSPHKDIKTKSTHLSCFCSHSLGCTSQLSGYSAVNTGILPSPTERSPDTTWLLISWLYSKQHSHPSLWIVGKESKSREG